MKQSRISLIQTIEDQINDDLKQFGRDVKIKLVFNDGDENISQIREALRLPSKLNVFGIINGHILNFNNLKFEEKISVEVSLDSLRANLTDSNLKNIIYKNFLESFENWKNETFARGIIK